MNKVNEKKDLEDPIYREMILEHWNNPQNYGVIADADFDVSDSNPLCGDDIRITGKIKNEVLEQVAFTGKGCAISQASASLFTEKIKGMKMEEIKKLTADDVLEKLGVELTVTRTKCALLVYQITKNFNTSYLTRGYLSNKFRT